MNPHQPKLGFSRTHRVRTSGEFRELTRSGKRSQDAFFIVHARPNSVGHGRLGVTVSRRVSHRAVDRNRIKRTIREAFRQNPIRLCGVDLVVTARPAALQARASEMLQSLREHWSAIQRVCKP